MIVEVIDNGVQCTLAADSRAMSDRYGWQAICTQSQMYPLPLQRLQRTSPVPPHTLQARGLPAARPTGSLFSGLFDFAAVFGLISCI